MKKKIIFNLTPKYCNTLLLEDNELAEYYQQPRDLAYQVGNVYLGTVKKIIASLNAAFVDIGHEKLAFLHYSDVSPYVLTFQEYLAAILKGDQDPVPIGQFPLKETTDKNGKIETILKQGSKIIVQISKEPISTKGIRITSYINLSGRYLILAPFHNTITLSKKITASGERKRLEQLAIALRRTNFGVIVRTLAQKKEAALLDQDFEQLLDKWERGMKTLRKHRDKEHACLIQNDGVFYTFLQNLLNEEFDQIVVDDGRVYDEIKKYVHTILPHKEDIVHLYQGQANIFQYLGIEKKIKNFLSKIVTLPGGGYLIVEHTEAMHVIDVNTGNRTSAAADQEALAVEINLAAAKMVAHLIRFLGDGLGGITIVDFVGMRDPKNKRLIYDTMKKSLKNIRVQVNISTITRFGLMEITRPRVRSFTPIDHEKICPNCQGTGVPRSSIDIAAQLEQQVSLTMRHGKNRPIRLHVHPFLYAYINRGLVPKTWKWWWKYKKSIAIAQDPALSITDYKIVDGNNEILAEAPKIVKRPPMAYEAK